jgi:hypothetical protein
MAGNNRTDHHRDHSDPGRDSSQFQEQVRRRVEESFALRGGRSVKEIVKEANQRAAKVSRPSR